MEEEEEDIWEMVSIMGRGGEVRLGRGEEVGARWRKLAVFDVAVQ